MGAIDPRRDITPFEIKTQREDGRWLVAVRGEIDLATVRALEAELNELVEPIVLDLRRCTFIDSTGLTLLLRATRDGVTIGEVSPEVVRTFQTAGLDGELRPAS